MKSLLTLNTRASLCIAATTWGAPAFAQVEPLDADRIAEIDRVFNSVTPDTPGCSCAASLNGQLVLSRAYGSADLERGVPLTPGSVFDAGSLQKQFVAAAALLLVGDGKLSLSDDIRTYIPELPDYGHTVTVDHLLTHTSGIRDWEGLLNLAGGKGDVLQLILRQRSVNFKPGEEFSYTNSGVVLMKEIIARVTKTPFGEFTRTRMFEPLGMKSTSYRADMREIVRDRALAYQRAGDAWRLAMLLDNDRGGGGFLTTSVDLVTWSDALANNRLGEFVSAKIHEPATLNSGRKLAYARGLFLDNAGGVPTVWHTGSANGYQCILTRFPDYGLSIAVMCNAGSVEQGDFAEGIFDVLVPTAPKTQGEGQGPPPPIPAGMDLSSRVGAYINEQSGHLLRLAVERGRVRIAGGPGLVPITAERLRRWGTSLNFMSGEPFELRFLSADEFELRFEAGKSLRYRRTQPESLDAERLRTLAGRYENDETGAVFIVEPTGETLDVSLESAPDRRLSLKQAHRDLFELSGFTVRFRRDEAGRVAGLDYSNPKLRNVAFSRAGDQ
jgi:CubicO group peptidase (beta-lactamase class C family)